MTCCSFDASQKIHSRSPVRPSPDPVCPPGSGVPLDFSGGFARLRCRLRTRRMATGSNTIPGPFKTTPIMRPRVALDKSSVTRPSPPSTRTIVHAAGLGELLLHQSPWAAHGAVGGSHFASAVGSSAVDALRAVLVRDGGTGSLGVCQRGTGLVGALHLVLYRWADGGRGRARAGSQHWDGKPHRRDRPHVAVHCGGRLRGDSS